MRMRDNVIHIGNDFFQSCMITSMSLKPHHSVSKKTRFAKLFCLWVVVHTACFPAWSLTLRSKPPELFQKIDSVISEKPFWQKPENLVKLEQERKILVSVTHPEGWSFKGAGQVQAPIGFCFEKAKDFGQLSKMPEYFSEVRFDAEKSILSLEIHFLGQIRPVEFELFEEKGEKTSRIYFHSTSGWLQGVKGALVFKDLERQATEVSVFAQRTEDVAWIPNWLFSVGAEAVMHHVAEQLRKGVETDYKK